MGDNIYDTYVYKIFKESIQERSLPKYIMIPSKDMKRFLKASEKRVLYSTKYMRYIKEVERKYFIREGMSSQRVQLEDFIEEQLNIFTQEEGATPFDGLEYIIGQIRNKYVFFTSELSNNRNLSFEIIMFLTKYLFAVEEEKPIKDIWKNITVLLQDMNKFLRKYMITIDEIESYDQLSLLYNQWDGNNRKLFDNFDNIIYRMDQVKEKLEEFDFIQSSVISYRSITYNSRISMIRYSGNVMILENTSAENLDKNIWIFDNFTVDNTMPVVHYNEVDIFNEEKQIKKYYKIFKNKTTDLDKINNITSDKNRRNTIYSYVPLKEIEHEGNEEKIETNYISCIFQLDQSLFSFKIPFFGIEHTYVIDICSQHSPFEINDTIEMSISGSFKLYNVNLNEVTFMDMLLNDDILNTYFYSEEITTSWVEKKRLTIHMKSLEDEYLEDEQEEVVNYRSALTAILSQSITLKPELIDIINFENPNTSEKVKIEAGIPYIEVSITKAENNDTLNHFFFIFNKVMQYYLENKENVEKQYLTIFPELNFENKKPKAKMAKKIRNRKSQQTKNEMLRTNAPDVFVANYARRCQKKRQPEIIENVKQWTTQKFTYKNEKRKREVLNYPLDKARWTFGCPDPSFPFPGVKRNTNLSNKNEYPFIPCCFERPQMDDASNSYYKEYYLGIPYVPKTNLTSKAKHKMITKKIVNEGSFGFLNRTIETIFSPFLKQNEDLLRFGVVRSVNSLLHCILVALDNPDYLELKTSNEKELFVRDMRFEIFQNIEYSLGKQEMYDYDENEITEMFEDSEIFIDPFIFFRYFEEYFDINIFTFIYIKNERNETVISLEIPRFKLFHSRPINLNRKSVLILKHYGSSSDDLEYPQCELIILSMYNYIEKSTKTFDKDISAMIYSIMYQNNTIDIWGFKKDGIVEYTSDFPYIDFGGDFRVNKKAQIIDSYGKLVGLILDTDPEIVVMTPPTRPQNLPIGEYVNLPSIHDVIGHVGKPNTYSRNPKTDKIEGLWYPFMNQKNVYYFPIIETRDLMNELKEGPHNFHFVKKDSLVKQIHDKRIKVDLILNYVIKAFKLSNVDVEEFIAYFMRLVPKKNNVDDLYEIKLLRNLGEYDTIETFLREVNTVLSNFVVNNKLQFYSEEFFENVIYFLRLYSQSSETGFKKWENGLTGYYKYEESFTKRPFVTLIIGEDKFKKWINATIESNENKYVKKTLNDIFMKAKPIVYYDVNYDKYYIIQPSLSFDQALNICDYWNYEKINYGINCENVKDPNKYKYTIYTVSNSGNLFTEAAVEEDIKVLAFRDGNFYSILELNSH